MKGFLILPYIYSVLCHTHFILLLNTAGLSESATEYFDITVSGNESVLLADLVSVVSDCVFSAFHGKLYLNSLTVHPQ